MDEDKHGIIIQFEKEDSSLFSHRYVGKVNPLQVIAACEFLILENKQELVQFIEQQKYSQAQGQILKPQ